MFLKSKQTYRRYDSTPLWLRVISFVIFHHLNAGQFFFMLVVYLLLDWWFVSPNLCQHGIYVRKLVVVCGANPCMCRAWTNFSTICHLKFNTTVQQCTKTDAVDISQHSCGTHSNRSAEPKFLNGALNFNNFTIYTYILGKSLLENILQ